MAEKKWEVFVEYSVNDMCGIAFIEGDSAEPVVRRMLATLAHRGPDGEGLFATASGTAFLGHRRLSIIDPAGGQQPIVLPSGGPAVAANGMIYNYAAVRDDLLSSGAVARFLTESDSESIVQSHAVRGEVAVRTLDGMFAYVISDGDRVTAARDPIGIKPLYIGRRDGRLCFASEIKALAGVADEVAEFPPGHVFRSGRGFKRYYTVPDAGDEIRDPSAAAEILRATLERAVVKRLRSDVPLGAFLSGGLDSSIIAAIARRHLDELHTFAVGLEGSQDLAAARRVADHLGTVHHEYVLTKDEILVALPKILYHLESYDRDLVRSAVPCWFVARLARDRVKVVLTGEGADELFAGYRYYKDIDRPATLQAELRRSITTMHNINLQRVDRMTMAHGLEARVPFLDTDMIALAARISPLLKLRRIDGAQVEKWILRQAFADLLPEDIVRRHKEQFDEGSGVADLLAAEAETYDGDAAPTGDSDDAAPRPRSAEEAWYRSILASAFHQPRHVLNLVAHWSERDPSGPQQHHDALAAKELS
jgi:asparagine synthase (glutamine-hydrolysing)